MYAAQHQWWRSTATFATYFQKENPCNPAGITLSEFFSKAYIVVNQLKLMLQQCSPLRSPLPCKYTFPKICWVL